ncbi:MAG TPA: VOC family protein, partial [Methylomirabilota bacterium]|nr:VOC family protein [Methylomirabilota bacterium]
MLHAIDHLVLAVPDLAAAIASYRELGFTVVPGGRHTGVGTDNALIPFRDSSYLELLGFYEPRPDHRWWTPLNRGGGLVDFCVQTDDLTGDAKVFRQAGVDMGEVALRDRRRPDGVEVRWVCVLARGAHRGVAPFLLAENGPREARVPRDRGHANGVTGIGTLTVVVNDLAAVRRWYGEALGQHAAEFALPELGAVGAR